MRQPAHIAAYLAKEAHDDFCDRRTYELDPASRFLYVKLKELYWSVTRLAGLARLHDGSRRDAEPYPDVPETADVARAARGPRVLIDMTATRRWGERTGVQRVVREISRWAIESGEGLPVCIEDGRLVPYYRHGSLPATIEIAEGDKFLMLDASFREVDEYPAILHEVSECGGETIAGLYDIIPLLYPAAVSPGLCVDFQRWFESVVLESDAVICISRSTAQSFVDHVEAMGYPDYGRRRIGWWRLGSDFQAPLGRPSTKARAIGVADTPFFLSVGTLEPRKGYSIALDAFEELWDAGVDARYVIVGRAGWQSRLLAQRIRRHAEYGRRLFWLDDADDASLRLLYSRARGLVAPSVAEGFGLPLVEAARHGLPVVASDIPAFREVAHGHARFFAPLDAHGLAERLFETLDGDRPGLGIPVPSWRESTNVLLQLIRSDSYQWGPTATGFGRDRRNCAGLRAGA
jgi:alpha-1,2-rhamnosyltransferase